MPGQTGARAGHKPRRAAGHRRRPRRRPTAPCEPRRDHPDGRPAWHSTHARGDTVSTYPDHILRVGSEHLAELKRKAAEFERQLWDAHTTLENEMAQSVLAAQGAADTQQEEFRWAPDDGDLEADEGSRQVPEAADQGPADSEPGAVAPSPEERTAGLVNHG